MVVKSGALGAAPDIPALLELLVPAVPVVWCRTDLALLGEAAGAGTRIWATERGNLHSDSCWTRQGGRARPDRAGAGWAGLGRPGWTDRASRLKMLYKESVKNKGNP